MSVYYTYNEFPYGTYEISAAILLQYNNNKAYPDIINLIKNYTSLLEEHIRYCTDFYIASKTNSYNRIIIECMANSEHIDLLNSNSNTISDIKSNYKNIETTLDIYYPNNPNNLKDVLREIIWRRYRIYKNQLNMLLS
jgi:hypothetical protein